MKLSNNELLLINGGNISTLLTAVVRVVSAIISFGKDVGSSIRRIKTKNYC